MGNLKYLFSCIVLTKLRFVSDGRNDGTTVLFLAALIFIVSGIKFCVERTFFFNDLNAFRQLWHRVPATTEIWVVEAGAVRLWLSHE